MNDGLIKIAQIGLEKQALAARIVSGIRGGTKAFDKNVFRPIQNITRPQGSKITRQGWDTYRQNNPALMYKGLGLGGAGYGLYKGHEALQEPFGNFGDAIGSGLGQIGDAIGSGVRGFGNNIGKIAGGGLPVLAFLLSRGKMRHVPGTLGLSALGTAAGHGFDSWNKADSEYIDQQNRDTQDTIMNRIKFYDEHGSSASSDDGSFRPNSQRDRWEQRLGQVTPRDRLNNPQISDVLKNNQFQP